MSLRLAVRKLYGTDREQLLRINAESRPAVAPLDDLELGRLLDLGGCHLVAVTGGQVLGYLLSFPNDATYDGEEFRHFARMVPEPYCYIDQVAILGEHRRRGVARQLYAALFAAARDDGRRFACCEVNIQPPNPASIAFHQRLGFHQIAEQTVSDGRTVAMFTRPLA